MVTHVVLRTNAHLKEVKEDERCNTINQTTSLSNQGTTRTPRNFTRQEYTDGMGMSAKRHRNLSQNCESD